MFLDSASVQSLTGVRLRMHHFQRFKKLWYAELCGPACSITDPSVLILLAAAVLAQCLEDGSCQMGRVPHSGLHELRLCWPTRIKPKRLGTSTAGRRTQKVRSSV